jgi:hypothetical protein
MATPSDDAASSFRSSAASLRGTTANTVALSIAFIIALVGTVGGALADPALTAWALRFFLVAVLLMVSSIATVSKLVRDDALADHFPGEPLAAVLRGSLYSRVLSWAIAIISVTLPPYALLSVASVSDADAESTRFLLLGLAYLFAATLNLAKNSRDRFDAGYFERAFGAAPTATTARALASIASGTAAFKTLNTITTAASFIVAIGGAWTNKALVRERQALFTVGLIFVAYSAMQVSKLVRDYADPVATQPRSPYAASTWAGFAIALTCHAAAIAFMPVTDAQRRFFALASLFVLSSVLALAKLLRDDQERKEKVADGAHTE